ncbi:hypothetical protein HMPREF9148_02058 [Prevotella sp. F0091]|nr:hypothetical protein HMPREF9148_02058 [Prevotella sp. F0091]
MVLKRQKEKRRQIYKFFGQGCQTSLTTLDGILIKKGGLFLGSFPNFL